jgi:predicted dehydrogenase
MMFEHFEGDMAALALPAPRTQDPMDAPPLRWGVLGTGWIAERFVAALHASTRQRVVAVGSRTRDTARSTAQRWEVGRAHGSYVDLVADDEVDIVYVATPHNHHHDHARIALEAGRHVLVEKPIALDASQAEDLFELARDRGLFCSEAMWTVFLPKYDVLRQVLGSGMLGRPLTVVADIGEWFAHDHRITRADLSGGPMLDLGTYAVMLATWVLGPAEEVVSLGTRLGRASGDVSAQIAAVMRHDEEGLSSLHTTIRGETPTVATIVGEGGVLVLDGPFYQPGGFTLRMHDGHTVRHDEPAVGHAALHFQAADAARRITAGRTTSTHRPPADSMTTMRAMDEVRQRSDVLVTEDV